MSVQFWKYSEIYLNRALKTAGLNGRLIPDVIGIMKNGKALFIEVLSKSQTTTQLVTKIGTMIKMNKNSREQLYLG